MLSDHHEQRPLLTDADVLEALAHPVRLDLLTYLMAAGPATASTCARAVGDTPSNCSYHLRTLARHGLVEPVHSDDGRQRPWRATITGFTIDPNVDPDTPQGRSNAAVLSASVALEQGLLRDYIANREQVSDAWRQADNASSYTVHVTPAELSELNGRIDALVRPLIAAHRTDAPPSAELVHLNVFAFPRTGEPWERRRR
ncbi:MAG TPA: helix-turn-helix domain-containing protein [Solirubrobacteraceae bacterium]|jgi:predicted transcriptional regulator|nr:helix-turn-helix domain-containing protein [Solirubrobacteraceae bacterium]